MADNLLISQAECDAICRQVLQKYASKVEDILRRRIESEIEGVTTGSGGPWYPDGSPYKKRRVLSGGVKHKFAGDNTLLVSSTASSAPSIISGSAMTGWGEYLSFHEAGNWGFMSHIGFARPAVTSAQRDADALLPQMEAEARKMIMAKISV